MSYSSRRRTAPLGILAVALIVTAATYVVPALDGPAATPPRPGVSGPAGDPAAAPRLAATGASLTEEAIDANLRTWSAMAEADANDYISATNVGVLYLGRARLTSNLDDYARAAAAVGRALSADAAYAPARALDATVRFASHDFRGALDTAQALLADAPADVDALAVIGDASLELGRIDDARAAYARLATLAPSPALDARLARLAYVSGDPTRALAIARSARDDAAGSGARFDIAFFEYQLGEFARLAGDSAAARAGFETSLAIRPRSVASLVGLARVEAAAGRTDEAIDLLGRAADVAPQPETLALLGDLLDAEGDTAAADARYRTVRFTAQLSSLAGAVYDRQLLAFELDHGGATDAIVSDARASLAARPDAAGHDLVAWALHRLGRSDEAAAMITEALATGIDDARITFHAGAIAVANGDIARGRTLLRDALSRGPALDPLERIEAERLLDP